MTRNPLNRHIRRFAPTGSGHRPAREFFRGLLVRLDSEGIRRVSQRIPPGRNPFTYFNRVIVSIDTLKNPSRYRHHLEKVRWDVVWVDESHKLVNRGTLNNALAKVLAPKADA